MVGVAVGVAVGVGVELVDDGVAVGVVDVVAGVVVVVGDGVPGGGDGSAGAPGGGDGGGEDIGGGGTAVTAASGGGDAAPIASRVATEPMDPALPVCAAVMVSSHETCKPLAPSPSRRAADSLRQDVGMRNAVALRRACREGPWQNKSLMIVASAWR